MGQVRYTIDRNHILFERDTKDKALFQKIRTQAQRQLNDWASPTSVSSYHSEGRCMCIIYIIYII